MGNNDSDPDFTTFLVKDLKNFLQSRGVPCNNKPKKELVLLAIKANNIYSSTEPDDHLESIRKRKIVCLDGETKDLNCSKVNWSSDLTNTAHIKLSDIFVYLAQHGKWTTNRLANYIKDDGHMLFKSNHVESISHGTIDAHTGHVYIQGKVKPEQRQSQERYNVWILVRQCGQISSAGCECVAADDGTCKHVIATLFAVEEFKTLMAKKSALKSCTELPCKWIMPRREVLPLKVDDMSFHKNANEEKRRLFSPKNISDQKVMDIRLRLQSLCHKVKPDALFLTLTDEQPECTSITKAQFKSISEYFCMYKSSDENVPFVTYLSQQVSDEEIMAIQNIEQNSEQWMTSRYGRLTASAASLIRTFHEQPSKSLLNKIFGEKILSTPAATEFGKKWEPVARILYAKQMEHIMVDHKSLQVLESGLIVPKDIPFIGASPDGIVQCDCHGKCRLVEIKCSYKHQNVTPDSIVKIDTNYHLIEINQKVQLKKSSSWYDQVQFQMGVTNIHHCDLVIFTLRGILVIPVEFDEELWQKLLMNARCIFDNHVVKALSDA